MINRNRRIFRLISAIILMGFLNAGCTQWENFSTGKTKRIGILEEQVIMLSDKVESINIKNDELATTLSVSQKQELEIEPFHEEYVQLKNKLTGIEDLQESHLNENSRLQDELSETRNQIQEIRQQLTSVETDKDSIKAQLVELEIAYEKLLTKEPQSIDTTVKLEKEVKEVGEENRESLIKKTQKKLEASLVEDLLNMAISLYRQGKYEDAIARWEEVLTLNPEIHEAKFNIEIAQDKIKEKNIQEGLKSNLIQRR
ncbi:MAG: tetratricopeptide repeat protein [Candidatus Scalindua sp.]|nr:tetratricopeptide repeat protein [Candidatus Scalindua sp.]